MKRLYTMMTLVIMMLVSLTTSAQVKQADLSSTGAKHVEGVLNRNAEAKAASIDLGRVRNHKSAAQNELTAVSPKAKAPANASATWTSMGTGTYREVVVGGWFGFDPMDLEVQIDQCNETPGYYRMANPYQAYKNAVGGTYTATQASSYLYIHAEDPDHVYFENFNTGWSGNVSEYGYVTLIDQGGRFVAQGYDVATIVDNLGEVFGTLSNGAITFPDKSLLTSMTKYNNGGLYYVDEDGEFRIILPGVEYKDYSVKVQTESCNADNKMNFTITAGADVETLKFDIYPGKFAASSDNINFVAQNLPEGEDSEITAGPGSYTLTGASAGVYTLFVLSYDAAGNLQAGAADYFYLIDDDNDSWTTLGTTVWGDNLIAGYYTNLQAEDIEAEIQENNSTPGYYRLVNPYAKWSNADRNQHTDDHNHYIYIHAEDPAKVWIEHAPVGFDMGDGMVSIASIVNENNFNGTDYGTLDGNKITFPAKSIAICEQHYSNGSWALTNADADFYIDLPTSTIKDKLDFVARKYTCSSGMSTEGDITEKTTYNSDGGHFTFTVNVAAGSTANRFWSANNGSQLRMYGVSAIVVEACEGYAFREVTTTGSSWATNKNYTANGLTPNEIKTLEGGSASASKMVWTGNSTNFILEVANGTFLNDISVVMEPTDDETTTYTLPVRDAAYTMTATLEEDETKLTALSLGSLKYHIINTGDITITKGETEVATIASSGITIASNAATITLDTPITEAGEYTITAPEGLFIYGGYIVGEKTIKVEVKNPTGIESVSAAQAEAQMFNLNGQAVKNAQRGLYIIGGKKVVK